MPGIIDFLETLKQNEQNTPPAQPGGVLDFLEAQKNNDTKVPQSQSGSILGFLEAHKQPDALPKATLWGSFKTGIGDIYRRGAAEQEVISRNVSAYRGKSPEEIMAAQRRGEINQAEASMLIKEAAKGTVPVDGMLAARIDKTHAKQEKANSWTVEQQAPDTRSGRIVHGIVRAIPGVTKDMGEMVLTSAVGGPMIGTIVNISRMASREAQSMKDDVYKEAIARGMAPEEARALSEETGQKMVPILSASSAIEHGIAGGKLARKAGLFGSVLGNALQEAGEETAGLFTQKHAFGEKPSRDEIIDTATISGSLGGLFGAAGVALDKVRNNVDLRRAISNVNAETSPNPDSQIQGVQPNINTDISANTDSQVQYMQQPKTRQQIVEEYQAAVDPGLVRFIEDVKAGKLKPGEPYPISQVTPEAAAQIKALIGLDVEGAPIEIQANRVRHINKRHGEKGEADRSLANPEDIARAKYVLDNADSIEASQRNAEKFLNSDGTPAKSLIVRKKVNGTHVVVEAVPNVRDKKLYVLSMWKTSDKQNKAKPSMLADADLSPPDRVVRNGHQDSLASDHIIPNPDQDTSVNIDSLSSRSDSQVQYMQQPKTRQQIVEEYQAAVDPKLLKYIDNANKPAGGKRVAFPIAKVSPRFTEDIHSLIGIDVTGSTHVIDDSAIKHIQKRHGVEGAADKSIANPADIARVGYVLNNYDSMELSDKVSRTHQNKDGSRASVVTMKKAINGDYVIVEAVPDNTAKRLRIVTMRIESRPKITESINPPNSGSSTPEPYVQNGGLPDSVKADSPILPDAGYPPQGHVQNVYQDESASDHIIPNSDQDTPVKVDNLSSYSREFFEPQMPQGTGDVQGKVRDIKKIVANVLDIPVREGNIRTNNILGFINHTKQVIRIKYKNDVSVLLHEFGHDIDARFGLSKQNNAVLQELASFGQQMGYTPDKHISEGIAQFFQWYGIDPEQARTRFPQYTKTFEDFINNTPDAKALVAPVFQATKEYYHGSPVARLRAVISDGSPDPMPLQPRVESMAKNAYIQLVDRYTEINKVNELTAKTLGIDKRMIPDEYNLEAAVRTYPGVMRKIGRDVEHITSQLGQITEPEYQQMVDYLTAGGALDYYTNNMEPGVGLSAAELQQVRANTPQNISLLADEIRNSFQQVVDDTLVRSGVISPRMIADWREKYPNYVPMIADVTEGDVQLLSPVAALNSGFVDQPNPVKKRKGATSNRDIIMRVNPLESMIKNIGTYHAVAAKNDVGQIALNISKLDGLAKVAEAVPGLGKNTFYVWENGKKKYFATDPEIYAALKVLGEYNVPNHMIANFAHKMSETFKAGTTRYNPWFIAKNFFRDSFTVSVQSGSDITDIKAAPIINTIDGLLEMVGGNNALLQEAIDDGVFYSSMVELKNSPSSKLLLNSLAGGDKLKGLKSIAERVGSWNENIEVAPKFREYKTLREQGLPRKQAAMEAREVNVDFQRAGTFGRAANQYIPFLNAQIQGVDKAFRTFKDHPVQSAMKAGLFLALPSAIEWALYHDDEEWQRMDQGIKDTHWLFRLPGGESDEFIRVPMPQEIGVVFGGTTKRVLNKMFEKDPAAWDEFSKSVKETMLPEFMPNVMRTGVELWSNKDMFRNRPIVPMREERLPARMQYGNSTSLVAKSVGNAFDVSPRKVDHAIRGLGGTMSAQAVNMLNFLESAKVNEPTRRLSDNPLIHPYTANSTSLAGSVNRFYKIADQIEQEYNGARQEHGTPPELAKEFMRRRQGMTKIRNTIAAIREHPTMTSDEKRKRINDLNKQAIKIAENGLKKYDMLRERK